jgi:hypothetical protein
MTASRGDTKPCTIADCLGTMQFGRRSDNYPETAAARRSMALPDRRLPGGATIVIHVKTITFDRTVAFQRLGS